MPPLPPPPPLRGGGGRRATSPPSFVRGGVGGLRRGSRSVGIGRGSTLRILICSGNLGNAEPSPNSVHAWLPPDGDVSSVVEGSSHPIPPPDEDGPWADGRIGRRSRGGGGVGGKEKEELRPNGAGGEEVAIERKSLSVGDLGVVVGGGSSSSSSFDDDEEDEARGSSEAPAATSGAAAATEPTAEEDDDRDDGGGKDTTSTSTSAANARSDRASTQTAAAAIPPRESPREEATSSTTAADVAPEHDADDDVRPPSPPRAHVHRRNKPLGDASSDRTDNTGRTDERTQKIDNTRTRRESGYFDVIVIGMQEATFGRKDLMRRAKKEAKKEAKAKQRREEEEKNDNASWSDGCFDADEMRRSRDAAGAGNDGSSSLNDSITSSSLGVGSIRTLDLDESDPSFPGVGVGVDDVPPSKSYPQYEPAAALDSSADRRKKKKRVKPRRRNTSSDIVSTVAKFPKKMVKRTNKEARKIGKKGITTFNTMAGDRNHAKGNNAPLSAGTDGGTDGIYCDGQEYVGLQTVLGPCKAAVPTVATIPINAIINPSFDDVLGTQTLHSLFQRRLPSYAFPVLYQRGEMRLAVGVRKDKIGEVGNVEVKAENTGLGSVMANKGGIVATLTIRKTRLSFLTAHLEAHEGREHYKGRLSDISDILEGTRPTDLHDLTTTSHHMFIMGDVNFRIDLPPPPPDPSAFYNEDSERKPKKWDSKKEHARAVWGMVSRKEWKRLNEADELHRALRDKECLVGFRTLPCYFPPTFKVERKAGFKYQPTRTPSYTDRILWKSNHGLTNKLRPIVYEPIELFETSDHKPIRGAFTIETNGGRPAAKPEPRRISTPPNSVPDDTGDDSALQSLHIFVTEMKCLDLTAKNLIDGKSNPYIMFVSDPKDLLRHDRTTALKFATKLGFAHHRSKHNEDGTKDRTHKGWPRTRKLYSTLDPDWYDDEIHLVIRHPLQRSTEESELDLTGAMLYLTVMDFDSTVEDEVIGTVALSLTTLSGSKSEGSRMKLSSSFTSLPGTNTTDIDEPLLNNGKVQGRLRCTIFTWFLEDFEESTMLAKRKLELRGRRKSECVLS